LRLAIKWLPKLTQALSFDLLSCAVTFEEIPGTKLSAENVSLHLALTLTQVVQVVVLDEEPILSSQEAGMIQNFGLWKKRVAEGFQRSLDTALREIHGRVDLSLKVSNLVGTMPHAPRGRHPSAWNHFFHCPPCLSDGSNASFLFSPGTSDFSVTASFNPKESLIDTHGLSVKLKIGDCILKVDLLNELLDKVLPQKTNTAVFDDALSAQSHPQDHVISQGFPWHRPHRALLPLSTLLPRPYFHHLRSFRHRVHRTWLLQNGHFFLQRYYPHDRQFLRHLPFSRHYLLVTLSLCLSFAH
jgi:hypothetical protein